MEEINYLNKERITKNIEEWKRKLLDFTKRNNLIYFRYNKKVHLRINELSDYLFNILINENKTLNLQSLDLDFTKSEEDKKDLQKLLSKLRLKANSTLKEKGINTLHLCLGILKWRESENSKIDLYSPLILLPVQITKEGKNKPFKLKFRDEEVSVNSSLMYKMKLDFGIDLYEEDYDIVNISSFLNDVKDKIRGIPDWEVEDKAFLGNFTFSKISMYKDLERYEDKIYDHEVVNKLAGFEKVYSSNIVEEIGKIPLEKKSKEIYQVLDADSSQQNTLVTSKQGYSFVIEGPPGTGKSQTISNIIAESIANEKKVLFVSEKVAALEVVANRLNNAGLGDYILELHSNKANKKQVISNIYSQYVRRKKESIKNNAIFFNQLDSNVQRLDAYVNELHKKYPPLDKSAFELHGELSRLSYVHDLNFSIHDIKNLNINKIIEMQNIVKELEYKHDFLYKYKNSLWTNISLDSCNLQKQKEIEELLSKLNISLNNLDSLVMEFNEKYYMNVNCIKDLNSLRECIGNINVDSSYNYSFFNEEKHQDIEKIISINKEAQHKYNEYNNMLSILYYKWDIFKTFTIEINYIKNLESALDKECFNNLYIEKFRELIIENVENINSKIVDLKSVNIISEIFGLDNFISIEKLRYLINILDILQKGDSVPISWFNDMDNIKRIKEEILPNIKDAIETMNSKIRKIEYHFKPDLYKKDRAFLINISNLVKDKSSNEKSMKLYDLDNTSKENLQKFPKYVNGLYKDSKNIFDRLGINVTINIKNLEDILLIIKLLEEIPYFNRDWFQNNYILILKNQRNKLKKDISKLEEKRNEIKKIFNESIHNIDYLGCYDRYKNQYVGKLRGLNSKYKKDKRDIERCLINNTKSLSFENTLNYLEKLYMYEKDKERFEESEINYMNIFGELIDGIDTDIDQIEVVTGNFEQLLGLWNKYGQPQEIMDLAIGKKSKSEIMDLASSINYNKDIYYSLLEDVDTLYGVSNVSSIEPLDNLAIKVNEESLNINKIFNDFDIINGLSNSSKVSFEELIEIINYSLDVNKGIEEIDKNEGKYKNLLGDSYNGLKSDWMYIYNLLNFTLEIDNISNKLSIQERKKLLKYISTSLSNDKENLLCNIEILKKSLNMFDLNINKFRDKNINMSFYNKKSFETLPFSILETSFKDLSIWLKNIDNCINNLLVNRKVSFVSMNEVKDDLNLINNLSINKQYISSFDNECRILFGGQYLSTETDWENINKNFNEIREVLGIFKVYNLKISDILINSIINNECRIKLITNLKLIDYYNVVEYEISELLKLQNNNFIVDEIQFILLNFKECSNIVDILKAQVSDIDIIIKIRNIINDSKKLYIDEFVYSAISNLDIKDNYLDIFNKRMYILLLDNIYSNNVVLNSFEKEKFERVLNEFIISDKKLIELNAERIKYIIDKRISKNLKNDDFEEEIEILSHENSKKKRHLPLRTLFSNIPNIIKSLKPCIMMSPLSVSQFIDLDYLDFDMVIFDEASQICPEDAIGAMLRGNQIIIAGDKKQLPPTKFFNVSSDDNDEYDLDENIDDFYSNLEYESILDLASTFMLTKRLLWHYRSRHESLIAFSNMKFYNNSLYTFPSTENNSNLGVKFEFVKGIYDQGGSATNIIEVNRVSELVINHFKETPNRSLGVITFGSKQMDCIIDMIEKNRKDYPELDEYFDEEKDEPFFVKNLENVQGDERDTIILSVCYGYSDENRTKLNHNFGPINKVGGERRLNVAITRAKYQLILVSSITDSDIDSSRTQSIGANLLKDYLYYSRTGILPESIIVDSKKQFDSPLEEDIYNELTKLGYEIDTQVGCSGYRIDLAIKDPKLKGKYVLGVECDGATYHSSKSARDRDRLRQEVLEGLGWNIHRIWSQDWFKNKYKELIEIKEKFDELII